MPENPDIDAVADAVLDRLDPGTVIDDKIILSKRQLLAIAGSGLGAGGLAALGISEASAQTGPAGQQGTEEEPNDMYAWDLNVANQVTSDLPMGANDVTDVGALETEEINNVAQVTAGDDLQAALDEAGEGAAVVVYAGTYGGFIPKNGQSIIGTNRDSVVIDADGHAINCDGVENVTIKNLTAQNDGSDDVISRIDTGSIVDNVFVPEIDADVISLTTRNTDVKIRNSTFLTVDDPNDRSVDLDSSSSDSSVLACHCAVGISDRGTNNNATDDNNVIL